MKVSVIGGTGFVGASIVQALGQRGHEVRTIHAPRLRFTEPITEFDSDARPFVGEVDSLSRQISGSDSVVNAAGDPNASSSDLVSLLGPNALLPLLVKRAAETAKVPRFIQVSSSVVQGDRCSLDSSKDWRPFSPYSHSKVFGEIWTLGEAKGNTHVVIYRPPSVHAVGRAVTERIRSIASSPLSSVAGKNENATPQALLGNVGDAVAFLATTPTTPPQIVHHPWEGLTTADLLKYLGQKEPRHIPTRIARTLLSGIKLIERGVKPIAPNRRRLELVWFGQGVDSSWLTDAGWEPPLNLEMWADLGKRGN